MGSSPVAANSLGRIFRQTSVAADTDLFSTSLVASSLGGTKRASVIRVQVCLAVSAVFRIHISNSGNTVSGSFNSGTALVAGATYSFIHEVRDGDSFNFQVSVGSNTVNWLYVSESLGDYI